jgi:hypothetical protein
MECEVEALARNGKMWTGGLTKANIKIVREEVKKIVWPDIQGYLKKLFPSCHNKESESGCEAITTEEK